MQTDAQKRAVNNYRKRNTTSILLRLFNNTEGDIIAKLESVENKNGYIKELIRQDIAKNGL